MAMTIYSLKPLLERERQPAFDDGVGTMICPFRHGGQVFNVEVSLQEEGQYLQFKIPYFLNLSAALDPAKFVTKLLELNRTYKSLKFGLDPSDGEVTASVEIYLGENEFSQAQMSRCLFCLMAVSMKERDQLLTLLKIGIYPGSADPGFTDRLSQLMPEAEAA